MSVLVETSLGDLTIDLDATIAPKAAQNFRQKHRRTGRQRAATMERQGGGSSAQRQRSSIATRPYGVI